LQLLNRSLCARMYRLLVTTRPRRQAFTLIEMMVVVIILGVLAALAIPSFRSYVLRSKTSEVSANFNATFKGFANYWNNPETSSSQGIDGVSATSHCTWAIDYHPDSNPGAQKRPFGYRDDLKGHGDTLVWLGLDRSQYVYFSYQINAQDRCGLTANTVNVATFQAIGDLDGDNTNSSFELAIGSDPDNQAYHSRSIYMLNEFE
jgi:prepilin-type N-terminal cleavage/methylation domain-containing protein